MADDENDKREAADPGASIEPRAAAASSGDETSAGAPETAARDGADPDPSDDDGAVARGDGPSDEAAAPGDALEADRSEDDGADGERAAADGAAEDGAAQDGAAEDGADEAGDEDADGGDPRTSEREVARVRALFTRRSVAEVATRVAESAGRRAAVSADPDADPEADPNADAARDAEDAVEEPAAATEPGADAEADADQPRAAAPNGVAGGGAEGDDGDCARRGQFLFARWAKPIAPAIFGVDEESAATMRQGFERAAKTAGLELADEDPEIGANVLVFFCERWPDLAKVPHLDRLIPDLSKLLTLLAVTDANQYRVFQFSETEGVKLAVVMLRVDADLASLPPPALALGQATQTLLVWSDAAFEDDSPVTVGRHGRGLLKRWHQRLIEAAYGADVPVFSRDPALAETLAARMGAPKRGRRGGGRRRASSSEASESGGA